MTENSQIWAENAKTTRNIVVMLRRLNITFYKKKVIFQHFQDPRYGLFNRLLQLGQKNEIFRVKILTFLP